MICDEVLAVLANGNTFRRWRARRHAARCPKCRETWAFLSRIRDGLAEIPPLTAEHRASWSSVADLAPARCQPSGISKRRIVATGSVAAAVIFFIAFHWVRQPQPPDRERPIAHTSDDGRKVVGQAVVEQRMLDVETVRRLDAMQLQLDAVERELGELSRQAELLDARRDADELWVRFAPPDSQRSL